MIFGHILGIFTYSSLSLQHTIRFIDPCFVYRILVKADEIKRRDSHRNENIMNRMLIVYVLRVGIFSLACPQCYHNETGLLAVILYYCIKSSVARY